MDGLRRDLETKVAEVKSVLENQQKRSLQLNSQLTEDLSDLKSSIQNSTSDIQEKITRQLDTLSQVTEEEGRNRDVTREKITRLVNEVQSQNVHLKLVRENSSEHLSLVKKMNTHFQVGGAFHKLVLQESRGIVDQ